MRLKREENYVLGGVLFDTPNATLYRGIAFGKAVGESEGLSCVLKKYREGLFEREALYQEMRITQEIENRAPKSIVIPIVQILEGEEGCYELLQLRENGRFLVDVIGRLEDRYGEGRIPLMEMLTILREVLVSLETLHSFLQDGGYLHLDLHPGNIFMESVDDERITAGKAKFIDFMTARKLQDGKPEAANAVSAVTPGFSAPELYPVRQEMPGPWTDIYSVCAIFYRMYTGEELPANRYSGVKATEEMVSKAVLAAGNRRGDNPILVHMIRSFLAGGLEEHACYRFQNAEECLDVLDTILKCARACGHLPAAMTEEEKKLSRGHLPKNMEALPDTGDGTQFSGRPDYSMMLEMAYRMRVPVWEISVDWMAFDAERLMTAVEELVHSIYTPDNDMEKAYYFFNILWKIFEKNREGAFPETYYRLVHSGMGICNKSGHLERAVEIYEDFCAHLNGVPLMEYLLIRNTVTGTCQRLLAFEVSVPILEENLLVLDKMYRACQEGMELLGLHDPRMISIKAYRKAMGAYGKHLAALEALGRLRRPVDGLPKNAMEAFCRANELSGGAWENRGDWEQNTRSILHYAVQTKNRELFEQYAPVIFGKRDAEGRFLVEVGIYGVEKGQETGVFGGHASLLACYEDILAHQELRNTMYVFLKGVHCFYRNEVGTAFLLRLLEFAEEPRVRGTLSAPIELAYRYCALLLWEAAERCSLEREPSSGKAGFSAEDLRRGAVKVFQHAVYGIPGAMIMEDVMLSSRMCRTYQTLAIWLTLEGKTKELEKLREQFLRHAENGWGTLRKVVEEGRELRNLLLMENC